MNRVFGKKLYKCIIWFGFPNKFQKSYPIYVPYKYVWIWPYLFAYSGSVAGGYSHVVYCRWCKVQNIYTKYYCCFSRILKKLYELLNYNAKSGCCSYKWMSNGFMCHLFMKTWNNQCFQSKSQNAPSIIFWRRCGASL